MSQPVLIVDDHQLVGTSLLLSLRGEGLDAHLVCRGDADSVLAVTARLRPGIALLDLDLGRDEHGRPIDGSRLVGPLTAAGWKVIILSGSGDRVGIGVALDAGALAWVPKNAPLPALVAAVRAAQDGRPVMAPERRDQLIATARRVAAERAGLTAKLARLSQREREVLAMLAQGRRAQAVADHFVVSLATVRTQIRGVLAKLEVSSQLEAVALYRQATGFPPIR
jgi:DNA-binding NarL/FixJ family response regulator